MLRSSASKTLTLRFVRTVSVPTDLTARNFEEKAQLEAAEATLSSL